MFSFAGFEEVKMKSYIQTVPWRFIMLVSLWLEILCVDSRPFFLSQGRPVFSSPDMLESQTPVTKVEKMLELGKHWADPDPKHVNKTHLMAMLGNNFDSFYMSIDPPKSTRRRNGVGMSMRFSSIKRKNAAISKMPRHIRQLQFNINRGDKKRSRLLGYRASSKLRQWLWELSRCPLNYSWVDYGLKFFPRYIRSGECIKKPCSFPRGMNCKPRSTRALPTLFWVCHGRNSCSWRKFDIVVNESCQCSC